MKKDVPIHHLLIGIGLAVLFGSILAYVIAPKLANKKNGTDNPSDTLNYSFPPTDKVPTGKQTPELSEERMCIQVLTPAINPATGEQRSFPTPCEVPQGWENL